MCSLRHQDILSPARLAIEIARERQRAARSGRPLILVSLDSAALFEAGSPDRSALINILLACTRQTDLIGWLEVDKSLGIVCTEWGQVRPDEAGEAIQARLGNLLRQELRRWNEDVMKISYDIDGNVPDSWPLGSLEGRT